MSVGPGREQEELRRKVENGVKELWYFIHSEIQKLSHVELSDRPKHTETLLQDLGHQQRSDTYSMITLLLTDALLFLGNLVEASFKFCL